MIDDDGARPSSAPRGSSPVPLESTAAIPVDRSPAARHGEERVMQQPEGVEVVGPRHDRHDEILTPPALAFLAELHRAFDTRRRELLAARA
ncbi:hypothetical protein ACFQZ8_19885, partial [Micromonospora azadirachtae]